MNELFMPLQFFFYFGWSVKKSMKFLHTCIRNEWTVHTYFFLHTLAYSLFILVLDSIDLVDWNFTQVSHMQIFFLVCYKVSPNCPYTTDLMISCLPFPRCLAITWTYWQKTNISRDTRNRYNYSVFCIRYCYNWKKYIDFFY